MTAKRTKQPPKKRGMKKPKTPPHLAASSTMLPPMSEEEHAHYLMALGAEVLKEKKEPEKKAKPKLPEAAVPAVYRERGYLVMTFTRYDGGVSYLDVSDEGGKLSRMREDAFLDKYHIMPDIIPAALALNLIARAVQGSFSSSVQVYRRLIAMAVNKEELMKMGDGPFAREYSRIMKLNPPLTRIRAKDRTPYIDKMIKKLEEEKENLSETEQQTPPGAASAPPAAGEEGSTAATGKTKAASASKEKGIGMTKKAKKKVTGAAASKRAAATKTFPKVNSKENPYRETSKKHKAFEEFKKGGERAAVIAAIKKTGVTDATASSWLNAFGKVKV